MRYKINLLPPIEQTFLDRIIFFSFNYLRYILVLTMLVVLGVFIYRFTVDQEIVDLKESLRQKQQIVNVSAPLLEQAGGYGDRILGIKVVLADQYQFTQMLTYYLNVFPEKITASKISVKKDEISLSGQSVDLNTVQNFYTRLKMDKKFMIYDLSNLRKVEGGYSFSLILKTFIS